MPKSSSFTRPLRSTIRFDGFEVTVHHQVAMRIADGVQHLRKQLDTLAQIEPCSSHQRPMAMSM